LGIFGFAYVLHIFLGVSCFAHVTRRTKAGVVHGNEVRVYSVTTEAEVQIRVATKPHLLEYMDLQMEALDEERLRNDLDAY
jgi:hypothetical protein